MPSAAPVPSGHFRNRHSMILIPESALRGYWWISWNIHRGRAARTKNIASCARAQFLVGRAVTGGPSIFCPLGSRTTLTKKHRATTMNFAATWLRCLQLLAVAFVFVVLARFYEASTMSLRAESQRRFSSETNITVSPSASGDPVSELNCSSSRARERPGRVKGGLPVMIVHGSLCFNARV